MATEPNERDLQYHITSIIFVIEVSLCVFTHVFYGGKGSSNIYYTIVDTLLNKNLHVSLVI